MKTISLGIVLLIAMHPCQVRSEDNEYASRFFQRELDNLVFHFKTTLESYLSNTLVIGMIKSPGEIDRPIRKDRKLFHVREFHLSREISKHSFPNEVTIYLDVEKSIKASYRNTIFRLLRYKKPIFVFISLPQGSRDILKAELISVVPKKYEKALYEACRYIIQGEKNEDSEKIKKDIISKKNPFLICSIDDIIGKKMALMEYYKNCLDICPGVFRYRVVDRLLDLVASNVLPEADAIRLIKHRMSLIELPIELKAEIFAFYSHRLNRKSAKILKTLMGFLEREKSDLLKECKDEEVIKLISEIKLDLKRHS